MLSLLVEPVKPDKQVLTNLTNLIGCRKVLMTIDITILHVTPIIIGIPMLILSVTPVNIDFSLLASSAEIVPPYQKQVFD